MSLFPFDVKYTSLYFDQVKGYPCAHPELRGMLEWLCGLCEREKLARPLITCFGRTRDDQEAIYVPGMLQSLEHEGMAKDAHAVALAHAAARARFTWHAIPRLGPNLGFCRAMDLRYSVWTDQAREALLHEARVKFPHAELLDHAVAGGGRHLHFGLPDPAGKPPDWL